MSETVDTKRYPLPEGVEDAVLNRQQLAEAFVTSANTIDRYRSEGMPVLVEGTNGQAYQFKLSDCWAWKCAREEGRRALDDQAERSKQQLRMQLLGGAGGHSEMAISPKERAQIYEVETAYTKLARERGALIPAGEVMELLDHVFSAVRSTLIGMPDRLSRDAGLTGRQSEQAVAVADDLLAELHRSLTAWLELRKPAGDAGAFKDAAE